MLILCCPFSAFPDLLNLHLLLCAFLHKKNEPFLLPPPSPCVSNIHHCISTCLSSARKGSRYYFLLLTGVITTPNYPLTKVSIPQAAVRTFLPAIPSSLEALSSSRVKTKSQSRFHKCKSKRLSTCFMVWRRASKRESPTTAKAGIAPPGPGSAWDTLLGSLPSDKVIFGLNQDKQRSRGTY